MAKAAGGVAGFFGLVDQGRHSSLGGVADPWRVKQVLADYLAPPVSAKKFPVFSDLREGVSRKFFILKELFAEY